MYHGNTVFWNMQPDIFVVIWACTMVTPNIKVFFEWQSSSSMVYFKVLWYPHSKR